MITNLDPASEHFLSAVGRTQRRLSEANLGVASGKRITVASDAPDEVSVLLQLKADQQFNARVRSNLAMAKTDADAADRALDASIKLMDRALMLPNQAGNSTLDTGGRHSIAQEIQVLQEQM